MALGVNRIQPPTDDQKAHIMDGEWVSKWVWSDSSTTPTYWSVTTNTNTEDELFYTEDLPLEMRLKAHESRQSKPVDLYSGAVTVTPPVDSKAIKKFWKEKYSKNPIYTVTVTNNQWRVGYHSL